MKKRLLSGALATFLLIGNCGAAFADIPSSSLSQTAQVLKTLGIMEGDNATTFAPGRTLTRAEFAKLVVTAFGVTDVTAYKNYTIFPDVPTTHWAAGYINAAVRHPDIQKKNVLHGYADGTFGPDRTISYGEACTMLLLMMGYTVEDIGPMWPGDYIARAQSMGLADGASSMTANSPVKRGDAAVMLLHTLQKAGKEGARLIANLTSSSDSEGAILLATSRTDSELRENQARFYTGGDEPVVKTTEGILDDSFIGVRGTLYYSKTSPSSVLAIVPEEGGRQEQYTVRSVERDQIQVEEGGAAIKPERTALMYVRGQVRKFNENWFDIQAGDKITLHYGKDGALELIRVSAHEASKNTFVYGTKQAASIPKGFTIEKNGVEVDVSKLKPYDVVNLDTAGRRAIVSDAKITGYYTSASPSFKNPEKITVLGRDYVISERAAGSFATLENGDRITLLLDDRGAVAAAYPAKDVRADMSGVFTELADGGAQIKLFSGATVQGPLADEADKNLFGRIVTVSQNSSGKLDLIERTINGRPAGDWAVKEGTLGGKKVAANVRVWEQVGSRAPLYETSASKIPFDTIPRNRIRSTVTDSAGQIVGLILDDVTGDAWNYGYGFVSSKGGEDEEPEVITATLRHYDYATSQQTTLSYTVTSRPDGVTGGPIGFPKGAEKNANRQLLDSIRLQNVGEVKVEDFDSTDGVRTKNGYYPISGEVQVYLTSQRKFITLNQARADYSKFTLYAERKPEEGGKIRVITVS
ncbi:MAG: S-layer homology domain-containing protein [Butyricicoccus sp.]|nr:S-layer homology domain-containing protein [Butyricicoccus sp.]